MTFDDFIEIPVGRHGLVAIIDHADSDLISPHTWYPWANKGKLRTVNWAYTRTGDVTTYMHRMILEAKKGQIIDHADGDGLNNRRCNLRFCTNSQNQANSPAPTGISGFRGVFWEGKYPNKPWRAAVYNHGPRYVGRFKEPEDAARARDRKALEIFGEFATLNFPEIADEFR